jgi:hypothetical protein
MTLRRDTETATLATTSAEVAPLITSMTGEEKPERTETSTEASRFKREARNSWLTIGREEHKGANEPKRAVLRGALKQTEINRKEKKSTEAVV